MKKILISLAMLMIFAAFSNAQNVITGKILDKNGIPIPGARISVKGGNESTLSEFDGSYRLVSEEPLKKISVDYVGYNSQSVKVQKSVHDIFMQKSNIWNRVPSKVNWIVSVQSAFPESLEQPSFGLMAGCVKKFGFYVKAMGGFLPGETATSNSVSMTLKSPANMATAGIICRLGSALHLTVGGGYAERKISLSIDNSNGRVTEDLTQYSYSAPAVDCGILLILGHLNINVGTIVPISDTHCFIGNFGVGFNF